MRKRILILVLIISAAAAGWGVVRFARPRWQRMHRPVDSSNLKNLQTVDAWAEAIEKISADRGEPAGGNAAVDTPPELRHYSDRHWFLATQVAEIEKHQVQMCQDYVDLAAIIQRGEMVAVPEVTDTYVLFGVGAKADDDVFTGSEKSNYDSLQTLAKNFGGRSYNLEDPFDRQALKVNMLRSLRPEALKILEQVASAYHRQFDRPLPVSSLVRPEEYQHALNRSNRNAVLIETPPHTTGLAFDIDYRYMTAAEQTFLMGELARLEHEGQIEAIRERNANYHVFAFINGSRPSDELIAASLDKATLDQKEAHHTTGRSAKAKSKSVRAKHKTVKRKRPTK